MYTFNPTVLNTYEGLEDLDEIIVITNSNSFNTDYNCESDRYCAIIDSNAYRDYSIATRLNGVDMMLVVSVEDDYETGCHHVSILLIQMLEGGMTNVLQHYQIGINAEYQIYTVYENNKDDSAFQETPEDDYPYVVALVRFVDAVIDLLHTNGIEPIKHLTKFGVEYTTLEVNPDSVAMAPSVSKRFGGANGIDYRGVVSGIKQL